MNISIKSIIFQTTIIILLILIFSNKTFSQDSLSVKSKNNDTTKFHFQIGVDPLRILNNRFSIQNQFLFGKRGFAINVDLQIKKTPFNKPLLFEQLDYNSYFKIKTGYISRVRDKKMKILLGLFFQYFESTYIDKVEIAKKIYFNAPDINVYLNEFVSSKGILINSCFSFKLTSSINLNLDSYVGYSLNSILRENQRNDLNDKITKNEFSYESKQLYYDLYLFLSFRF
jgi:hypothetical protein